MSAALSSPAPSRAPALTLVAVAAWLRSALLVLAALALGVPMAAADEPLLGIGLMIALAVVYAVVGYGLWNRRRWAGGIAVALGTLAVAGFFVSRIGLSPAGAVMDALLVVLVLLSWRRLG